MLLCRRVVEMGHNLTRQHRIKSVSLRERPFVPCYQCRGIYISRTVIDRTTDALNKRANVFSLAQQLPASPRVLQALLVKLHQPFLALLLLFNPLPLCTLLGFAEARARPV